MSAVHIIKTARWFTGAVAQEGDRSLAGEIWVGGRLRSARAAEEQHHYWLDSRSARTVEKAWGRLGRGQGTDSMCALINTHTSIHPCPLYIHTNKCSLGCCSSVPTFRAVAPLLLWRSNVTPVLRDENEMFQEHRTPISYAKQGYAKVNHICLTFSATLMTPFVFVHQTKQKKSHKLVQYQEWISFSLQ